MGFDPRYLGFFGCFNRQRYFEAHEVLEALWLPQRQAPNGAFYKGLIQLAGAFVHWQRNRPGPAAALFGLARANLRGYPATHEGLDVEGVLALIEEWLQQLKATVTIRRAAPAKAVVATATEGPDAGGRSDEEQGLSGSSGSVGTQGRSPGDRRSCLRLWRERS